MQLCKLVNTEGEMDDETLEKTFEKDFKELWSGGDLKANRWIAGYRKDFVSRKTLFEHMLLRMKDKGI